MATATKRTLTSTHKTYQPTLWDCYTALYEGGSTLLQSDQLETLFPSHVEESPSVYAKRIERLVYANYAGLICSGHVVTLFGDPLQVEQKPESGDFYKDFLEDASAAGGVRTQWADMLRKQLTAAMVSQGAWTRVCLPSVEGAPTSRAEQEDSGQLDAYATPYPAACVSNWHETDDGRLQWILLHTVEDGSDRFGGGDTPPVHVFEHWTDDAVTTWEIPDDVWQKAKDDQSFTGTERVNVFKRIPFVRMEFPPTLWLMDQLYTLARELLNKHSALAWAEYRALFPHLVVYVQNEQVDVDSGVKAGSAEKVGGILRSPKGPGYAWVLAVGEAVEWVAPPTEAFEFCMSAIEKRKVELARTVYALNVAADLSSGSQRRTAESKTLDIQSSKPFLQYLGREAREHTRRVLELVAHLRGEQVEFEVSGLEHVQPLDVKALIENAVGLAALELPSPTFKVEHGLKVARGVMGHEATDDMVKTIREELVEGYAHLDEVPEMAPGQREATDTREERK